MWTNRRHFFCILQRSSMLTRKGYNAFSHKRFNHLFPTIQHLKQFQTFSVIGLRFKENRKGSKLKMPKYLKRPEHQRPISKQPVFNTRTHAAAFNSFLITTIWGNGCVYCAQMWISHILFGGGEKSLWTITAPWQTLTIWLKNKLIKGWILNFDAYKCSLNTNVSLPQHNPPC